MNRKTTEYTVLVDRGLSFEGVQYGVLETVSLDSTTATPLLEKGHIAKVTKSPPVDSSPSSVEPLEPEWPHDNDPEE